MSIPFKSDIHSSTSRKISVRSFANNIVHTRVVMLEERRYWASSVPAARIGIATALHCMALHYKRKNMTL